MAIGVFPRFSPETTLTDIAASLFAPGQGGSAALISAAESDITKACGAHGALMMPSARAGLYWIMRALKPPRIYLPAFLCSSIYECVLRAGIPVTYLDVKTDSFETNYRGIDFEPGSILLLVHQYGIPCDPEAAREVATEHRLVLVEDIAASLGSRWAGQPVGSFGDAAIASFEFSKTISACKGGAAVFKDLSLRSAVLREIEQAQANGELGQQTAWLSHAFTGMLYRFLLAPLVYGALTLPLFRLKNGPYINRSQTIEAGGAYQADFAAGRARLLRRMLLRLPRIAARRRAIGEMYRTHLKDSPGIRLADIDSRAESVYTHFPLLVDDGERERIVQALWQAGVDPGFNFSYLCGGSEVADSAPRSLAYTRSILTLPVSTKLTDDDVRTIALALRNAVSRAGSR